MISYIPSCEDLLLDLVQGYEVVRFLENLLEEEECTHDVEEEMLLLFGEQVTMETVVERMAEQCRVDMMLARLRR